MNIIEKSSGNNFPIDFKIRDHSIVLIMPGQGNPLEEAAPARKRQNTLLPTSIKYCYSPTAWKPSIMEKVSGQCAILSALDCFSGLFLMNFFKSKDSNF